MVQTTLQPPAQELTLPPEVHPTKAEWEDLQSDLYTLGYLTERQTAYLKKINELLVQLPHPDTDASPLSAVRPSVSGWGAAPAVVDLFQIGSLSSR